MLEVLEVTREEARLLHDAVVDRLIKQRQHIQGQERPSERAYENLDTLQALREKLKLLQTPRLQRPRYFP